MGPVIPARRGGAGQGRSSVYTVWFLGSLLPLGQGSPGEDARGLGWRHLDIGGAGRKLEQVDGGREGGDGSRAHPQGPECYSMRPDGYPGVSLSVHWGEDTLQGVRVWGGEHT